MRYLSVEDIKRANQKILDKFEGYKSKFFEPEKERELDKIVARAKTYKEPAYTAAIYLYDLNKAHIFNSANKRTAFLAVDMFLYKNKMLFEITDDGAIKLSKDIRNDLYNFDEVKDYMSKRIKNRKILK
jgi:death-on-curing family protein